MVERKYVTIKQACEIAGVVPRTIHNWLNAGKLEYVRTPGGHVRIVADTLFRDPSSSDDGRSAPHKDKSQKGDHPSEIANY